MIIIAVTAAVCFSVFAFKSMAEENRKTQEEVYTLLEKNSLTEDEKDFIQFATDDRECKEDTVFLDEAHAKLFKEHFGYNR